MTKGYPMLMRTLGLAALERLVGVAVGGIDYEIFNYFIPHCKSWPRMAGFYNAG